MPSYTIINIPIYLSRPTDMSQAQAADRPLTHAERAARNLAEAKKAQEISHAKSEAMKKSFQDGVKRDMKKFWDWEDWKSRAPHMQPERPSVMGHRIPNPSAPGVTPTTRSSTQRSDDDDTDDTGDGYSSASNSDLKERYVSEYLPETWEFITSDKPAHARFRRLCHHIATSRASAEKSEIEVARGSGATWHRHERTLARLLHLPEDMAGEPEGCTLEHVVLFLQACNFGGEFTMRKTDSDGTRRSLGLEWEFTCSNSDPEPSKELRWVCKIQVDHGTGGVTVIISRPIFHRQRGYTGWQDHDHTAVRCGFTGYDAWKTFSDHVLDSHGGSAAGGGGAPVNAPASPCRITQEEFLARLRTFLAGARAEFDPRVDPPPSAIVGRTQAHEALKNMMAYWRIPVHSTDVRDHQLGYGAGVPSHEPVYFRSSFADRTII